MFVQEKQGARCISVRIIRITCMNLRTEEVLKSCSAAWLVSACWQSMSTWTMLAYRPHKLMQLALGNDVPEAWKHASRRLGLRFPTGWEPEAQRGRIRSSYGS